MVDQQVLLDRAAEAEAPPAADDVVISARGIGKMYRIYDRPQDRLKQMFWRGRRMYGREFWALRGVSLEVERGEALGIIGRNGSGKSTLLQIIAGTLAPSEGEARVSGRVGALLELGSGFNPEFTGRENVLLNGAILGLTREEMEARFDAIAAFADIGEFIDQPIKIYSSGMLVRLAFAVQAHIQPDILIVDEALAVGDVYFQHKCMRRIKELVDQGTTLLFVSHVTETVKRFCRRGLWLDGGQARYFGEAGVAVEKYLAFMRMREVQDWSSSADADLSLLAAGIVEPDVGDLEPRVSMPMERLLPRVGHEIDLADDRLFLRGQWNLRTLAESSVALRSTVDHHALAGFVCEGSRIELAFLRGPDASAARITVDKSDHIIELFHPGNPYVEWVSLNVPAGQHTVLIRAADTGLGKRFALAWIGGRSHTSPPLAFRRDSQLGVLGSDVERYGSGKARLTAVELLDYATEQPVAELSFGQRVRLRLHAERLQPAGPQLVFSYIVRDRNRIDLFGATSVEEQIYLDPLANRYVVEFAFDVRLGPGSYSILAAFVECSEDLKSRLPMDCIDLAKVFTVTFDPDRPVWYVFHEPVAVRVYTE